MAAPSWTEIMESNTSAVGGAPRERSERRETIERPLDNEMTTFPVAATARIV